MSRSNATIDRNDEGRLSGPLDARTTAGRPVATESSVPLTALTFCEFDAILGEARCRFERRMGVLGPLVESTGVRLFGYGGKGRMLAKQIAANAGVAVTVYDSDPRARALAAKEGFSTIADFEEFRRTEAGIILGACQAQQEQASLVGRNRIYYQEAAHLFDAPHLSSRARDFSEWIVDSKRPLFDVYRAVDERSRETFVRVLSFRLSLDPADLAPCKRNASDMWFDVLQAYGKRSYVSFLDVGAYDGDTLLQARKRLSVRRGIAVEANAHLFPAIEAAAKSYEDGVRIVPQAAWSHRCRLRFSEVRGGMISVFESDDGGLEARPIDEGVSESVDLLKMDIEGSELEALKGAVRTLATGPDLALAAYHRPDDLVQIPRFVEGAGYAKADFDLHVAHYSDCLDDTIFYFLRR